MSLARNNPGSLLEEVEIENGNELFPVFLKLNYLRVLMVGAGPIGLEKLSAVLKNSPQAKITIVAEQVIQEVRNLASRYPEVNIYQRKFELTDLDTAELVMVASNNNDLNLAIRRGAKERRLLVNVADKPSLCDFYLGSIVQKGDLKIAISTNGKSPTIAKRLKEVLDKNIPDEIDDSLQQMSKLRKTLNGNFAFKVKRLNEVTDILVTAPEKGFRISMKWLLWASFVVFVGIIIAYFWHIEPPFREYVENISSVFYYFLAAGFVFAMIDGAIGMSYGVTSTSFSLLMGVPPASASMAVHLSEILSNGIAGWMHYQMGNVNKRLFMLLLIPGVIGAILGAYLLSSLEHYSQYTKPVVSLYTLVLGAVILSKAFQIGKKKHLARKKIKKIGVLGFGGGFVDAVGGGGWGSIVLSSLIAGGRNPRTSLGTVKITRFFIAIMSSLTFVTMIGGIHWNSVAGLIIGSALASPIAARVSNRISTKTIMVAVGIIVISVSLYSILKFVLKVL